MTIAYLIHSLHNSGGMERVLSVKASWLADNTEHRIFIITASLKGRKPYFDISSKVILCDLGTGDSVGLQLKRYKKALSSKLKEINPDICISMGGNEVYILPDIEPRARLLVEYHFSRQKFHIKYHKLPFAKLFADYRLKKLERAILRFDRLVLITKADYYQWSGVCDRLSQIYNPVTLTDCPISSQESKTVCAAGRLVELKNYPSMLRIWSRVVAKHPDWMLNIYGEGNQRANLEKMTQDLSLCENVRFHGAVEDIAEKMAQNSIMLLSSNSEGFSLCLIEAARCGLALVSYDCPTGPREIISDGENGFLIPLGDEEAFASALCQLIEDPVLRVKMASSALNSVQRFSLDNIMAQWLDLFNELVDKA